MASDLAECPITHTWMTDPVTTSCGHTFDHSAITQWAMRSRHAKCPVCRTAILHRFVPSYLGRRLVDLLAPPGTLCPRTARELRPQEVAHFIVVRLGQADRRFKVWPRTKMSKVRAAYQYHTGAHIQLVFDGAALTDEQHPTVADVGVGDGGVLTAQLIRFTV